MFDGENIELFLEKGWSRLDYLIQLLFIKLQVFLQFFFLSFNVEGRCRLINSIMGVLSRCLELDEIVNLFKCLFGT